jgi:hypothetical protein
MYGPGLLMKKWRLIGIGLLALGLRGNAADTLRVSIPELLRPETRLQAFQKFQLRAETHNAQQFEWANPADFRQAHRDLLVSKLSAKGKAPRYLVTWHNSLGFDWESQDENGAPSAETRGTVIVPRDALDFQIFSAKGVPLPGKRNMLFHGAIADLKGDGEPLVVEEKGDATASGIPVPGLETTGFQNFRFLQVRKPDELVEAAFAILLNTHPPELRVGNTWGYQLRDADGDGVYSIEIGPTLAPAGVDPKVEFHWDRTARKWVGPEPKPGDHFRVLTGPDPTAAAERIVAAGGLGYPLVPPPPALAAAPEADETGSAFDCENLPPDRLSKPYHATSLAGLSDGEMFTYMAARGNARDYLADTHSRATTAPEFWTLPPPEAALAYVRRNRPAAINARYQLSFAGPAQQQAPDEGDITLSDSPSGCFAPRGAYIHHLHCAREGSWFSYFEYIDQDWFVPPPESKLFSHFRKSPIPHEQARQLFQNLWWMSRLRSRALGEAAGQESGWAGSTSDGYASVQIVDGDKLSTIGGGRAARYPGRFVGVGYVDGSYERSSFINLAVQIFGQELPERFGLPAAGSQAPGRWPLQQGEPAETKAGATEMMRLFLDGKFPAEAMLPIVQVTGAMGWRDLRPTLAELTARLPSMTEYEKQRGDLDVKIRQWENRLETGTGIGARWNRHNRRNGINTGFQGVPGLDLPQDAPPPPPPPHLTKEEEATFGEFDALCEKRDQLDAQVSPRERQIAELRTGIQFALRQLDSRDDANALWQWALQDNQIFLFAVEQLEKLDRQRAVQLIARFEGRTEDPQLKEIYAQKRIELEGGDSPPTIDPAAVLSDEERALLLATLRDGKAKAGDRQRALEALVPATDPQRYPDPAIDTVLLGLLPLSRSISTNPPDAVPLAAARRLGGRAWDALVREAKSNTSGEPPRLSQMLPSLTLIALREPEPYRAKLRDLLAPEFTDTCGSFDAILWSIWLADLRELKPELERIATNGPLEYESIWSTSATNHRQTVKQRFHRARHIAALWNEEDAFTRARLLVAFAAAEASDFANGHAGALEFLDQQLTSLVPSLAPAQLASIAAMIDSSETAAITPYRYRSPSAQVANVLGSVRTSLGLTK